MALVSIDICSRRFLSPFFLLSFDPCRPQFCPAFQDSERLEKSAFFKKVKGLLIGLLLLLVQILDDVDIVC